VGSICRKASPTYRRYYRLVHGHGPFCNIESRLSLGSTWCRDIRLRVGVGKSRRRLVKGQRTVNTSELRRAKGDDAVAVAVCVIAACATLGGKRSRATEGELRRATYSPRFGTPESSAGSNESGRCHRGCSALSMVERWGGAGDAGSRLSSGRCQSASRDTRHVLLQPPSVAQFHPRPETQQPSKPHVWHVAVHSHLWEPQAKRNDASPVYGWMQARVTEGSNQPSRPSVLFARCSPQDPRRYYACLCDVSSIVLVPPWPAQAAFPSWKPIAQRLRGRLDAIKRPQIRSTADFLLRQVHSTILTPIQHQSFPFPFTL
jgi:hypothetical protein